MSWSPRRVVRCSRRRCRVPPPMSRPGWPSTCRADRKGTSARLFCGFPDPVAKKRFFATGSGKARSWVPEPVPRHPSSEESGDWFRLTFGGGRQTAGAVQPPVGHQGGQRGHRGNQRHQCGPGAPTQPDGGEQGHEQVGDEGRPVQRAEDLYADLVLREQIHESHPYQQADPGECLERGHRVKEPGCGTGCGAHAVPRGRGSSETAPSWVLGLVPGSSPLTGGRSGLEVGGRRSQCPRCRKPRRILDPLIAAGHARPGIRMALPNMLKRFNHLPGKALSLWGQVIDTLEELVVNSAVTL